MSQLLANLARARPAKRSRAQVLALRPDIVYNDGRTKQSHRDETDIVKIMGRFAKTGTISHLAKFEGVYADFADFDFHTQITKLAEGNEIFAALPAEVRKEFGQDPAQFFKYVNDEANRDELRKKLPALAKPGQQLPRTPGVDADLEAADAAAIKPQVMAKADLEKVLQDALKATEEPKKPDSG